MSAEGILANTVTEILKRLAAMLEAHEIDLSTDVKVELVKLQSTLNMILQVMTDAERKQWNDASVKAWMKDLKALIYEADDILDEFIYENNQQHKSKKVPGIFHFIAFKIRGINIKLCSISSRTGNLGLVICIGSSSDIITKVVHERNKRRKTNSCVDLIKEKYSCVHASTIFGRENDKSKIIDMLLMDGCEAVSVIPIVGMGGLGKTTLAQLVYNDNAVINYFDTRIWVCTTKTFDVKNILVSMIEAIMNKNDQDMPNMLAIENYKYVSNLDVIVSRLQGYLKGKTFLLVLDDVWNKNRFEWNKLKIPLTVGAIRSKIIITTRSNTVASIVVGSRFPPYQLPRLPRDDCWNMFIGALGGMTEILAPEQLLVARELLIRCGGLPLAVKFLGSKGIVNQISTLIQLWWAEGFIFQSDGTGDMPIEEIGETYFRNLLDNSFFQDVDYKTLTCKMHDLVHDFAQSVMGNKECLIVEEISTHNVEYISKTRRLHLINLDEEMLVDTLKRLKDAKELRSLFMKGILRSKNIQSIISNTRRLRVLDLSETDMEKLPYWVRNLKHLRYLDLSNTNITWLPESITELYNLQTLKLNGTKLKMLPESLHKMSGLKTLEFNFKNIAERKDIHKGELQFTSSFCLE